MPYYPKSRIIENQKANPGEFTLPENYPKITRNSLVKTFF